MPMISLIAHQLLSGNLNKISKSLVLLRIFIFYFYGCVKILLPSKYFHNPSLLGSTESLLFFEYIIYHAED